MKKNIFTAILLIITVLSFSCSSASDELPGANIEKISNPNVNLELEDITSLGFKKNKTYKVKDLPEAKSAYYGFLKIPKTKESIDYELRFYPSQQTAIDKGVSLTEEVIGEDAVLKKSTSSWKEGIQDRRSRNNSSMSGSEANSVRAKYLDYFINGNVIILCSGLDLNYATQNCSELSSKIE